MLDWFVYIIECSDNSYYTGITNNLERRFAQHLNGTGAKFFRGRKPLRFIYTEANHTRSTASSREFYIKKLSRKDKEKLIKA